MLSSVIIPLPYCDRGDIARLLSDFTLTEMVDDNYNGIIDGTEADDIQDAISLAADTINGYCDWQYTPEMMQTSMWVNRCATALAAYELSLRRRNECPEGLLERAEKFEERLQAIMDRLWQIPNIPRRMRKQVVYSNIRIDLNYQRRCIRVEKRESSGWSQTLERQNIDWGDLFTVDWP